MARKQMPWMRSVEESDASEHDRTRHATAADVAIVLAVATIIAAMAIWFLFFASGGPGPGTV